MAVLNDLFDTYLENIEPDPKAVKYAQKAHKPVREHLESDADFAEHVTNSFLYGSYKRHTAVGSIKDVDIVIVTDFDTTSEENTPQRVLRKLKTSLSKFYKDPENPEYQRRSIRINDPLPDNKDVTMTLDIIPAVPISDSSDILLVPDRESKQWVFSNPKGHIGLTSTLNGDDQSKGRFVPFVKIMKSWWKHQCTVLLPKEERPKPKGFWIECLTAENFDFQKENWSGLFISVLNNISTKYKGFTQVPELVDPGLSNEIIKTNMTLDEFKIFMAAINESLIKAAYAIEEQDEDKSSRLWQEIFGEDFPTIEADTKIVSQQPVKLGNYSHVQPLCWPVNSSYKVTLNACIYSQGGKKKHGGINSNGRVLSNGLQLKFEARTNAPRPYEVYWQVVNTGPHASSLGGLRGDFFQGKSLREDTLSLNPLINWEHTEYTGKHWVECFIVKDGVCVATSGRFFVNIKNSKY